jgi:hypothetical protein
MYAGRVKIAVSALCGLVERLTAKAIRIGRFAGAVLLDLSVVPFDDEVGAGKDFVRAEVRGLHLRPTYVPAFVADGGNPANFGSLVLPLQGSASADADHLSGVFQRDALPGALQALLTAAGDRGVLMAASEVPLTIIDGELGRVVQGPAVTTWPRLQPAGVVAGDGGPDDWDDIPPNQRFVPQTPLDPVDPEVADECLEDCPDDCAGCDCGCHLLETARAGVTRLRGIVNDDEVRARAGDVREDLRRTRTDSAPALLSVLEGNNLTRLLDAVLAADRHRAEREPDEGEPDETEPDEDELDDADLTQAEPAESEGPGDQEPVVYARSEQELTALDRLSELVAEQSGRLERRVGQIQDSAEIRRFVVAALRAAEQARTADDSRSGEKE